MGAGGVWRRPSRGVRSARQRFVARQFLDQPPAEQGAREARRRKGSAHRRTGAPVSYTQQTL
ncbi:MAG: hypothetical protein QUU85_06095, partial [Candidatus Eisenbacteria bacterium]|nr:hypothetical protein [Candidatus Eisenbacteria bacterium]